MVVATKKEMSTQTLSVPPQDVSPEDQERLDFDQEVMDLLLIPLMNIAEDLEKDLKVRQYPDGIKKGVYGKNAATKKDLNGVISLVKNLEKKVAKKLLLKKKKTSGEHNRFLGFAQASYISDAAATTLGLVPGQSLLWKEGVNPETGNPFRPIASSSILTMFFTHYVSVHNLIDPADTTRFKLDSKLKSLFEPFLPLTATEKNPVVDMNSCTYKQMQKLITYFTVPKNKETNPGPTQTPELMLLFENLTNSFDQLKEKKANYTTLRKLVERAATDLQKAEQYLKEGTMDQASFNRYKQASIQANHDMSVVFEDYKQSAQKMGI